MSCPFVAARQTPHNACLGVFLPRYGVPASPGTDRLVALVGPGVARFLVGVQPCNPVPSMQHVEDIGHRAPAEYQRLAQATQLGVELAQALGDE